MRHALALSILLVVGSAHAETAPDESDPVIASVIFYSQSYAIERLQGWCKEEVPSSASHIAAAREEWDRIHRPLWDKVPGILKTALSREQRLEIAVQARRENDEIVARLAAAPRAEREGWCESAPARILSEELNLMGRSTLVRAIAAY